MGSRKNGKSVLMCSLLIWLVSQQVTVTPAMSRSIDSGLAEEKNYSTTESPEASHGTPHTTPSHGGRSGSGVPSQSAPLTPPSAPVITNPPSPTLVPPAPTNPNSSPFSCDYWRAHPEAILALLGYWCTLGEFFGLPAVSAFGRDPSLLEALSNTRSDGIGALYREGTASLLNSLVNRNFALTTQKVREEFNAAVISDKAAATQAQLFKKANEGHLKHH
nr:PREDICTED: protodermal factor 1-like [Musa acuminata subsp. malaccensis]